VSDIDVVRALRRRGVRIDGERATVWFESGRLSDGEARRFAGEVNQGIDHLAGWLGVRLKPGRIRYYIGSGIDISHAYARAVFLPLRRVLERSAPYLHETTHILAPCDASPLWFSEGLASYAQSYVSENLGGYDGRVFSRDGNRSIDLDARDWLARIEGQAVLPFIGAAGEPPGIVEDRSGVAEPFYVLAQSFVKFVAEQAGVKAISSLTSAPNFEECIIEATSMTSDEWKRRWLEALAQAG
jgi:hypothetical protein